MKELLIQLIVQHPYLVYGIIILIACIEGPILSILLGVLMKLGYVGFLPIYVALMVGDLLGDVIWYSIGYFAGHRFIARFGKYFSITEEGVAAVTRIFHKYKNRILIVSKLTSGFGFAIVTLMTAGIVKIPFKKYIILNTVGQFFWSGILIAIGYFFGHVYSTIDGVLGKISLIVIIILAIIFFIGYGRYMRKRFLK